MTDEPIDVTAPHGIDAWTCDECGSPLEVGMFPFCGGDPNKHVQARFGNFPTVEVEIDGVKHVYTDLGQIRHFEREQEKKWKGGDGAPMIFREFSQDRSNRDKNTLADYGWKQHVPKSERVRRGR